MCANVYLKEVCQAPELASVDVVSLLFMRCGLDVGGVHELDECDEGRFGAVGCDLYVYVDVHVWV
jgi:hypothetical protein